LAPKKGHGGYWTNEDWATLSFDKEEDWQTAITLFEDRITVRYFDVLQIIEGREFSGFVVMSILCLLIEALEQFIRGVKDTPARQQHAYFDSFLRREEFQPEFSDEVTRRLFVSHVRNGLLHQAEVKGRTRIIITKGCPLVRRAGDDGLIIQRREFAGRVRLAFLNYVASLRGGRDLELRARFRNKMAFVCDTETV
jgi:hypothetical protein